MASVLLVKENRYFRIGQMLLNMLMEFCCNAFSLPQIS